MIVHQLIELGCQYFCLAPGSRSAPLVQALASETRAQAIVCHDERSLGFFALGIAKATQKPTVIIVTSGTAVANLFPAVVEASQALVPLIILSADRPQELRALGGNQTIDQNHIFGRYARAFVDLPEEAPAEYVQNQVQELYLRSMHPTPGPVQINCPFREPFEQSSKQFSGLRSATRSYPATKILNPHRLQSLHERLRIAQSGTVVVGHLRSPAEQKSVLQVIERLGWPAVCDISSGLRLLKHPLLRHDRQFDHVRPDLLLQIGGRLTLKATHQWLHSLKGTTHFYLDPWLENQDPWLTVTDRFECDLEWFSEHCPVLPNSGQMFEVVETTLAKNDEEAWLARCVSQINWKDRVLFAGTSLPIRYLDRYGSAGSEIPWVVSNRGASGIDGIISTAAGLALGCGKALVLLCGDMTFLHDVNGLSLLKNLSVPLLIVLVNNRGNGIFKSLPIANSGQEIFERYFQTPHDYSLNKASELYGVSHWTTRSRTEFSERYQTSIANNLSGVLEFQTT
ncbi:MAG: 2-succinyl-5-enolpyruvyl-6-hydroxy-3-cyclohexene-1-carboxylic-acid synthase [Myxococcaceae bacterium]|nr:2-succinyl-5-enolpyruvyl-6-hydroxy-3-cyclohexene-1-carboxylic-acid synthase [Myxococcaceae bacterium]MBH2005752.1 2-succinyl-5-enolpyruvyl-6-hydroxy-3-cyclohexene-1-carboxylic-acid synthase [Myxococcaceae bacterium]